MLLSILKSAYHALVPLRLRRMLRLTRWRPNRRARARLWRQTDGRVAAGPFAGLRLLGDVPDDCEPNELIGSYECELHPWVEAAIASEPGTVVNIGSASGYYSTGFALRLPNATVYAFEMQEHRRLATQASAARNGVGPRVRALGAATVDSLAACRVPVETGALVFCDCEGAEREILDPARVPWFTRSVFLVELHDFAAAGATETILARFRDTHDAEFVDAQPRDAAVWAERALVSVPDARTLTEEPRMWGDRAIQAQWLRLTPRASTPAQDRA